MRHMKRGLAVVATALAAAALSAGPAVSVTGGEPDGARHPNVGALIADFPGSGPAPVCSGTLVSPTVFLTAGHCVASLAGQGVSRVWVTFDPTLDPAAWTLLPGAYYLDPAFGHDRGDLHDLAVVVLSSVVAGVQPAALPPAGLLDRLAASGELRSAVFVNVGYGFSDRVTGGGKPQLLYDGARRVSTSPFGALTGTWLKLSSNANATGQGGVCYGDSGGPRFLGGSSTVVAITSGGDAACAGMSSSYRLDTPSARAFLSSFVALP